jgi:ribose transport system substrate-binding protein
VSAFLIFIFWYNNLNETKNKVIPTSIMGKQYKIYLITMVEDQYWMEMNQGAKDMADLLGINYILKNPEKRDVQLQIELVKEAVKDGADAILIGAINPVRISSALEDAKANGVKIVYVDAPAIEEATTTLATDNYSAGRIAAETMISQLEAKGIEKGTLGILGLTPEIITTTERERGFIDVIKEDGRYTLLDIVNVAGDTAIAQEAAEALMENNEDLVGILGTHIQATIGLGNAIMNSDKKIVGIGFDYTETIQEMVKNDVLQAVLVQNPYTMGYLGVAEAVASIKGYKTGPEFFNTGVSIIDKYTPIR